MTAEVLAMHATKFLCKSMQCKDIYLMPLIALSLLNRCGDSGGCTDSFGGCRSRRTLGSLQNQSNFSSSILLNAPKSTIIMDAMTTLSPVSRPLYLHPSSKVCMINSSIHNTTLLLHSHNVLWNCWSRPLARNLDTIGEELDGSISCYVHIAVFAPCSV